MLRQATTIAAVLLASAAAYAEPQVSTLATVRATAGMSVAEDGSLIVADFGDINTLAGTSLYRLKPDGSFLRITDQLSGPSGNFIDSDGSILQSEYNRNRVVRVAADGSVTPFAQVPAPDDLAMDANGVLHVASCPFGGGVPGVYRVDASGSATALTTDASYGCVSGLTFDSDGILHFSSFASGRIYRRAANGEVSVFASLEAGATHIKFANDRFYVMVPARNQVMTISRNGEVSVLAGTGQAGTVDGPAAQAQFNGPFHLEVSPTGRYLVVDGGPNGDRQDNPIRVIDLFPERGEPINAGITGTWFDPNQSGHGIFVEVLPANQLVAWWFTFDAEGRQSWFGGVGTYDGNAVALPITQTLGGRFIPNFNPAQIINTPWGSATLRFSSCDEGQIEFQSSLPGYGSGSMILRRLTQPLGVSCAPLLTK